MKRKLRDIRDTGCINMHMAGKAKSSTAAGTKHKGMQLVKTLKVLMCVFMLYQEKKGVGMRALPWGGERKLRAHLLCYYSGSGKGFASGFTAQQASFLPTTPLASPGSVALGVNVSPRESLCSAVMAVSDVHAHS